jgi:hypothetical protein
MSFYSIGDIALGVLDGVSTNRVAARDVDLLIRVGVGGIEKVAWLRATDRPRRVDASLLTEGYERNWNVRAEGEERRRLAHLQQRTKRPNVRGRRKE